MIAAKQTVIYEVYVFSNKISLNQYFLEKIHKLHLFCCLIRIIVFKRAEPRCYSTNFPYASSGYQNGATMRNAPYVLPRHDSILQL